MGAMRRKFGPGPTEKVLSGNSQRIQKENFSKRKKKRDGGKGDSSDIVESRRPRTGEEI